MSNPSGSGGQTAKGRYDTLATTRAPYLQRAEECALLTIPSLLPKQGHGAHSKLPTPYQGMGARGINNLSSKMLLALIPPNQSFFRLVLSDDALQQLTGSPDTRTEVEKALGQIERTVQSEIETTSVRVSVFEVLKYLLVTGNVLVYVQPEGGLKVYRLDRYVVKRDPTGAVLEIVVKEVVAVDALPKAVQDEIKADNAGTPKETTELYTWIVRKGDKYKVHQEVNGKIVPGTKGSWPKDRPPFIALRWVKIDGEDYGRGHVEEYLGDLRSLEHLTKAIVQGSAAAARGLILVNPNGTTDERTVSEAPNWAVRSGNAEDVTILKLDKYADFQTALATIANIQTRLAQAFLLTSSVQRQAERVTAEEIRLMAGELEDALGGVYSILSQEFQLPFVKRLMFQLQMQNRLPQLPENLVKPSIVTGLEALGRGHDLNRLMMFSKIIAENLGPDAMVRRIKEEKFIIRVGTSLGMDMADLVKSDEEYAAEQAQAQQAALVDRLGPEVLKAGQAEQQQQQEGAPNGGQ